MELRQLEYFQMVCKFNNITRAAESLHVSQPSITNSIKNLENELGVTLLDRSNKQIRITNEGKIFLERVDDILSIVENTVLEMQDYGKKEKVLLRIGIPPMIGTFLFPRIFVEFTERYSETKLQIIEKGSIETKKMIENDELDLAIIIVPKEYEDLEVLHILKSEILVCFNNEHFLNMKNEVSIEDIKNESIIMLKEGFYHRQKILDYFHKYKIEPNIILSSNQLETIKSIVSNGSGISFLMKEIIQNDKRISSRKLNKELDINIGLVWKKERYISNAAKTFIEFILKSYRDSV
jgi:DNA-binding transcriptional LysR family regulator